MDQFRIQFEGCFSGYATLDNLPKIPVIYNVLELKIGRVQREQLHLAEDDMLRLKQIHLS